MGLPPPTNCLKKFLYFESKYHECPVSILKKSVDPQNYFQLRLWLRCLCVKVRSPRCGWFWSIIFRFLFSLFFILWSRFVCFLDTAEQLVVATLQKISQIVIFNAKKKLVETCVFYRNIYILNTK